MLKKLLVLVPSVIISLIIISLVLVPSIILVPNPVSAGGTDIWLSCCVSGCDYSPGQEVTFDGSTYCCESTGWTPGSCILPCDLVTALVSGNCAGGSSADCEQGESITMTGSYTGDCSAADFFQIDAIDTLLTCGVQYSGGDMSGIWDSTITVAGGSVSGSWVIPAIASDCYGKTVFATAAALYDGGASGTQIDLADSVSGSFRLVTAEPTTTTITTTTTSTPTTTLPTTTTTTASSTTTTIPGATTTTIVGEESITIYKGANIVGVPGLTGDEFSDIDCGLLYYTSSSNPGCLYDDNGYFVYYDPLGNNGGDCDSNFFSAATMEDGFGYYLYAENECEITFDVPTDVEVILYPKVNIITVPLETSLDDIADMCGDKDIIFTYYTSSSNPGCLYDDNGYFVYYDPLGESDGDCDSNFFSVSVLEPFVGYYVYFNGKDGDGETSCTLTYEDGVFIPTP